MIVSYTLRQTPFVVGLVSDHVRAEHDSSSGDLMWDVQLTYEDDAPAFTQALSAFGIPMAIPKPAPEPQHFRVGANSERELHDAIVARGNGDARSVGDPTALPKDATVPTLATLLVGKTVKAADESSA